MAKPKPDRYFFVTMYYVLEGCAGSFVDITAVTEDGSFVVRNEILSVLPKIVPEGSVIVWASVQNIIELPKSDYLDYVGRNPEPIPFSQN